MSTNLLRPAGCAMVGTQLGVIVGNLKGLDELSRLEVSPAELLLTDHKIIEATRLAELAAQGLLAELRQLATFRVEETTKLFIHGIDQLMINFAYHGWLVFEAGSYTVYAAPPVRPASQVFLYAWSYWPYKAMPPTAGATNVPTGVRLGPRLGGGV